MHSWSGLRAQPPFLEFGVTATKFLSVGNLQVVALFSRVALWCWWCSLKAVEAPIETLARVSKSWLMTTLLNCIFLKECDIVGNTKKEGMNSR